MVTIWQKLNRIKSSEVYKVWVYRIVVNKCYDYLRNRKKNPEVTADENTWVLLADRIGERTSTEIDNTEIARIISLLTGRLSPKQKAVFVLADLEDMTPEEISEITGMSRRNIKANLHYARKNIGEMIAKYI
jgi:RNA polymerase sigma-70 factor (ECF subfamily)